MEPKIKRFMTVLLISGFVFVGMTMLNGCGNDESAKQEDADSTSPDHEHAETAMANEAGKVIAETEQTHCPVMEGNKIDKQYSVEYKGKTVYFCCPGCDKKFLENPEKYIAKLPQFQ